MQEPIKSGNERTIRAREVIAEMELSPDHPSASLALLGCTRRGSPGILG